MRVAITGDRYWTDPEPIERALRTLDPLGDFVVLGDARGVDTLARQACEKLGLSYRVHVADWGRFKGDAGPRRNTAMLDDLEYGTVMVLDLREVWYFHDDLEKSRGTKNCVNQARARGLTIRNGREIS